MYLLELSLAAVGEHVALYTCDMLQDLPQDLLETLVGSLNAEQLLRLDNVFSQRNVDTDRAWQTCFRLRWNKSYERFTGVFVSRQGSSHTKYINKHFQEVFNRVIKGQWSQALQFDDRMSLPLDKTTSPGDGFNNIQSVSPARKKSLLERLRTYTQYCDRWSMRCSYIQQLLDHPNWLKYLLRIRALRVILATDSNFRPLMSFVHWLRVHGSLEEVELSKVRWSEENSTEFVKFCCSSVPDQCLSYWPLSTCALLSEDELDLTFEWHNDSLPIDKATGLTKAPLIQSIEPPSKKSRRSDCEHADIEQDDESDLFDLAVETIMKPADNVRSVHPQQIHDIPEPVDAELAQIIWEDQPCTAATSYTVIVALSVYDGCNELHSQILDSLSYWPHLQALALDVRMSKEEAHRMGSWYSGLCTLIGRESFTELHCTDVSNCHLSVLYTLVSRTPVRQIPIKFWKCSLEGSLLKKTNGDPSIALPSSRISLVEHLEVSGDDTVTDSESELDWINVLWCILEHDTALRKLTLNKVHGDVVLRCLQCLQVRAGSHLEFDSLSIQCSPCSYIPLPYVTESLTLHVPSLRSLTFNSCRLFNKLNMKTRILDDIMKHMNLRELCLPDNMLGDRGCSILETICTALIDGQSKIHTLDLSDNQMSGEEILRVAQLVETGMSSPHREARPTGSRGGLERRPGYLLVLNNNFLVDRQRQIIRNKFSRLFNIVEVKCGDCLVPLAEYIGQM